MSNFVSLDEAAKKLGVSAESLVEMLSKGDIFGYRDGGSWKFKPQEIERVASEMLGDVLDEDPAGSSILVSESDLGISSETGSTIGSDLLSSDSLDPDGDIALVPEAGEGSDVRLVANQPPSDDADADDLQLASSDDDDDDLSLETDDDDDLPLMPPASPSAGSDIELGGPSSSINLASGSGRGSDIPISGSDEIDLAPLADSSGIMGDSDLSLEGSDLIKSASESGALDLAGSDLELTDDGDLVLGGGSDLAW